MFNFPIPWDFALILLVLAAIVPWRGAVKVRQLLARPVLDPADRLTLYATTIAFQWVATTIIIWRSLVRGISLDALGFDVPKGAWVAGVSIVLSLFLVANQLIGLRVLMRSATLRKSFVFQLATRLMPQNLVESLAFAALAATVALCEETIYRGFALLVFAHAARDSVLAGVTLSSALFAAAHAYQGRKGIIQTFIVGLLFAVIRIWTGSLVPTMAGHLTADLVAGLAAPRFLGRQSALSQPSSEGEGHSRATEQ
jgi:membrane protease YdiL (CAAX protease family)